MDAIPDPVFVVDGDLRIVAYNAAAENLLGDNPELALRRRGGDVLHCVQAAAAPHGCGTGPACSDCIIRNSVAAAYKGTKHTRRAHKMELLRGTDATEVHLLVTAAPLQFRGEPLVLLVLEDVSELFALKAIVPMCAGCRKLRDDDQYWRSVESYFKRKLDINFTHGLCPECVERLYPGLMDSAGESE